MALRDWNGDGQKDLFDNMIEYEIYKNVMGDDDDDVIKDSDSQYEREYKTYRKIYANEAKSSSSPSGYTSGTKNNNYKSTSGETLKPTLILILLMIILYLIIFLLDYCSSDEYKQAVHYREGIQYLEQGDYKNAVYSFAAAQKHEYGKELYEYAEYMRSKEGGSERAYEYIRYIPESYDGPYAEEIKKARETDGKAYKEYLAQKDKEEQEYVASLKKKLPEAGMSTYYISDTKIGKYDNVKEKYNSSTKEYDTVYSWYSDDGSAVVFVAECSGGRVRKAYKMNEKFYWIGESTPNFGASRPKPATTVTSKKKEEYPDDPYDVYDYYFVEDFYDDHYDDFWDYYDAEDYYEKAWDKVK